MAYAESTWKTSYDLRKPWDNHVMFDDESFGNHNNNDQSSLHKIRRKISQQKVAAEHRSEQLNGNQMSRNSYSESAEFDPSLRSSTGSRLLHDDNDVIIASDFSQQAFHQPNTRKVTKITPKENHSISNSRPVQPRSASASSGLPTKYETKDRALTPSDIQRLKHVRRHEPAQVSSGPAATKSLITPDSWKTHPVVLKKPPIKKSTPEIESKPVKRTEISKVTVEQSSIPKKPHTEKPKRERSRSKAATPEPTPKPVKPEKTKEEKEKIQKYIQEKRHEHEQNLSNEKQSKRLQEKERKEKLKILNEQIKKVAQQPLPASLIKKSESTQLPIQDHSELTRERMLHLLGPRINVEPPTEQHRNTPFELPTVIERSRSPSPSSSSSSSSESIVEIQPPKFDQPTIHARAELLSPGIEQRHHNILRWAMNLTRDCDSIENKLKYLRPDGTQPFDLIAPTHPHLQLDDGNLRSQKPIFIAHDKKTESKPIVPLKILRPSGRLISTNENRPSEYQGQQLPGVGDLRDPALERRVKRDRAAAKIQAVYRGYTVRKSIHWIQDKQQRLNSESNKRPIQKPKKSALHPMDIFDTPALNLDMRLSDDNFTIGSTLLRLYQQNGTKLVPSTIRSTPAPSQQPKIERPVSVPTYSDDFDNITSTSLSTPVKPKSATEKPRPVQQPIPEKPRVIEQPVLRRESSSSSSSSESSSVTITSTSESHLPSAVQHRRSMSPPLPPQMSSDSGRPIHHHQPPLPPTSHRKSDERRYSPEALERQLNAELHLLDGVEASMKQVDNMERLRSVALAQQEVVSLAQVLKNKPAIETVPQSQTRKSSARPISSSSSSSSPTQRHHSPPRRRTTRSTSSSSSETILTARARQKFYNETELKAYETRLKDVEQKIRVLDKRDEKLDDQHLQTKVNASEIFDEKRPVTSPRVPPKSSNDSSISEDIPVSHKSSSSIRTAIPRKTTNDTSEIQTELIDSFLQHPSDTVTTDGSGIERRIRTYQTQIQTKKTELDKLKQRKNKDALRRQEEELKKQLETYNHQIETLRAQPVSTPSRKLPAKASSSSSSSSSRSATPTKPQESSIAEELPGSSTPSQTKTDLVKKTPVVQKERDFFDDDEDEEEDKPAKLKPLETPRDERDTQHDAQSLSITTDIASASETENEDSRRPSIDNGKPILNFNKDLPSPLKSKDDLESSSSTTTSERASKKQSFERKVSPVVNDYDEDFSDASHSRSTPTKEPVPKTKIDDIDIESIQEDLEDKRSSHDTNQSLSSKSSADEQSEILVLVKKSANTTPRRQDDKTFEDELPLPPPVSLPEPKVDTNNNNDDTSHDVSEDEEVNEQETKADKLTDLFLRTFIDEAINQGTEIDRLKKVTTNQPKTTTVTQAAIEWMSDEDFLDDDHPKPADPGPNQFAIDLSVLTDEPRVESPRKAAIEEPVKPLVPHTHEEVIQLSDQALKILFDQNTDFSNRETIHCQIPNSYFTDNQQDPENENIRRNHHAYCQMIFNLTAELLHEMHSENIQSAKYPEWQKSKLISKRFYRGKRPTNRREIEQIIQQKIVEILNLTPRPITYSKWRVSTTRRSGIEKFETVLDEEIRRGESEWINYDDDCTQMKFDVADLIFDQLIQETLTECFHVMDKRLHLSSNSTRL